MRTGPARDAQNRRGTIAILAAIMMAMLMGMAAFSVDFGYILIARTDLQAAADAAALAAARELLPDAYGSQYHSILATRASVRQYANINSREGFQIPDADIEIGRYDRNTIYSGGPLTLLNIGVFDTVRVTLRQDGILNETVPLFFARALGLEYAAVDVTATAILPPVTVIRPGNGILPFAVDIIEWNQITDGEQLNIFDDHMEDADGNVVPGNWCTVDIGAEANATSDLIAQMNEGLRQTDLDFLAASTGPDGQPRIPNPTEIADPLWVDAEPGLSTAMKDTLEELIGVPKIIPLFDIVYGTGDTAQYHIVSWGVVMVTEVELLGALSKRHITLQRCSNYDGTLTAASDLSDTDTVQGAFAAAMLVE